MTIDSFAQIADRYQVFFFDAFGVLKNYRGLIPSIERTFDWILANNRTFYVLTNDASRSPDDMAESYYRLGLSTITPDRIITSGMLAREYLSLKVPHGTVAYLGTPNSAHYIETAGLQTMSISQLDLDHLSDINALVLLDDEGFDWNTDLNKAINLLRLRNIPVIVANTDTTYPVTKNQVAVAIGGGGRHDRTDCRQAVYPVRQARCATVYAGLRTDRPRPGHRQTRHSDDWRHAAHRHSGRQ